VYSDFLNEPVHSGSTLAQDFTEFVYDELWSLNLDSVTTESYHVLLSKLNTTKPNFVRVFYSDNDNQTVVAEGYDISDHRKHYNFASYSPSADITVITEYSNVV